MRTRDVRGLELTSSGLGGAQFGNLYREVSDETVAATVATAWDAGCATSTPRRTTVSGCPSAGSGRCWRPTRATSTSLSTKVGRLLVPDPGGGAAYDSQGFVVPATTRRVWDFSRDGVRRSIEESLTRLGLDRIDIAYLHDPEDHGEQALAEGLPALLELRDEGVLGAVGAGMNFAEPLTELVREHDVDVVMCAGRHTLLERADELLDAAQARGVGVVVAGVYNSGLLARPRPAVDAHYNYEPAPAVLLSRVNALADTCEAHGVSLPEAALAFPFRHPAVVSVVVGAAAPSQVTDAVDRLTRTIPDDLWTDLALPSPATQSLEGP